MDQRSSIRIQGSSLTPEMKQAFAKIKPTTRDQIEGRIRYWAKASEKFWQDFRASGGTMTPDLEMQRKELCQVAISLNEFANEISKSRGETRGYDWCFAYGFLDEISFRNQALKKRSRFYEPPSLEEVRQGATERVIENLESQGYGLSASVDRTGEIMELAGNDKQGPYEGLILEDKTANIVRIPRWGFTPTPDFVQLGKRVTYVTRLEDGLLGERNLKFAFNLRKCEKAYGRENPPRR